MTESATREGVDDAKAPTDWESIEREYRAGVLSVREIAKRHGITHGAINKRAKRDGWARDLTQKVREAVSTALVSTPVSTQEAKAEAGTKRRTEREIVDEAAATVVALVREHRADLREGRDMAVTLLAQLRIAAGNRDELDALILEATAEADTGTGPARVTAQARRKAMLAAVSLPAHIGALRDLSNVLKNLIPLERQAFNVDDGGPPDPPDPAETQNFPAFEAFSAKLAAVVAKHRAPAEPA